MNEFTGFPPGDLKYTSVPDIFFAQLLPYIDDLAELKIILHIIWIRQRQGKQGVSFAELQTDETLINSLSTISDDPQAELALGLANAIAHKVLLHARFDDETGLHDMYFLNSEGGRLMLAKLEAGEAKVVYSNEVDVVSPRARRLSIFQLYEENIGLLTPIIADELKDAEATYPEEWIEDAFKIAVEQNVRKWSYIRAVLDRMGTDGRNYETDKRNAQDTTRKRWFTDEEYEHFFKR